MANKKISEFTEALSLVDNAFIPIIQGNPLDDYKITADNLIKDTQTINEIEQSVASVEDGISAVIQELTDLTPEAIGAAPALTVDDNYVTDVEKANLHAPGSDNQDLTPYELIVNNNIKLGLKSNTNHNHNLNDLTEKSYNSLTDKPNLSNKLDINGLNGSIDKLHFGVNTTTPVAYDLYQNIAEETLSIKLPDGGSLEIGKEMFEIYTNIDTVPLVNGDIVSIVQITGNRRGVKRCDVTTDNARTVVGMVTVPTIAVNGKGRVTTMGNVHELNTSTYTEGLPLYVSSTNPGKWTQTMPSAPNYVVEIGSVEVSHQNQGIVNLNLRCNPKFTDLSDVNGTPLTVDGQLPIWHNTTKVFDFDKNINDYRLLTNNVFGTVTDNTTFEADGTLKMNGTATVFDDLTSDITRAKTVGTRVTFNDTEMTMDFTSSSVLTDYIVMSYQLSHKWKVGSVIHPHIHWAQAASQTPNWLIQYRWQILGGAKVTAWTNYKSNVNVITYTSGTMTQISHDGGISSPVGAGASDIIQIRLIRDTNNTSGLFTGADNYSGTVSVLACDIHYEQDSLGSHTEYTK